MNRQAAVIGNKNKTKLLGKKKKQNKLQKRSISWSLLFAISMHLEIGDRAPGRSEQKASNKYGPGKILGIFIHFFFF